MTLIPDPQVSGAWLVRQNGADQSWIDPNDPTRLEFDYMVRFAQHIEAHAPLPERLTVIHIGGAGMSMARYVAATRPTSPQIVFEPDTELTAQVRQVVPLGKHSGIKVRPMGGVAGIAGLRDDYADIVILDAFAGGQIPADVVTDQFFTDIARVLHPSGELLANLVGERPFDWARRAVAGLRTVFGQVVLGSASAVLTGRRSGNLVAAASQMPLPIEALERATAGSAFPHRLLHGMALTKFLAGAKPFTSTDTTPSPIKDKQLTWFE
jgi:spermidine synthase